MQPTNCHQQSHCNKSPALCFNGECCARHPFPTKTIKTFTVTGSTQPCASAIDMIFAVRTEDNKDIILKNNQYVDSGFVTATGYFPEGLSVELYAVGNVPSAEFNIKLAEVELYRLGNGFDYIHAFNLGALDKELCPVTSIYYKYKSSHPGMKLNPATIGTVFFHHSITELS